MVDFAKLAADLKADKQKGGKNIMAKRTKLERPESELNLRNLERPGMELTGIVKGTRIIDTKFGPGEFIDFVDKESGEMFSHPVNVNLKGYGWNTDLVGKKVSIVFEGWDKQKNGMMKQLEVYLED